MITGLTRRDLPSTRQNEVCLVRSVTWGPMDVGLPEQAASGSVSLPIRVAPPLTGVGETLKRLEDLLIGVAIIILMSWLLVAIAIAIKLSSRGPVIFRQARRGRHNSRFGCLKFRTMHHEWTDQDCAEQTRPNDPRVTRIGKFLRRHSLDELPQLFNVIAGDMSLVGPRPHAFGTSIGGQLLPEINEHYLLRYQMRPGITGWAQVNGWRGILDTHEKLEKRVEHDLYYTANWSLLFDVRILFKTIFCLFTDERAH